MRNRNAIVGVFVVGVAVAAWALFRPELLFVETTGNETFGEGSRALLSGDFHKGAHETKGTATIVELSAGKRELRLTDFETSNGPDVQVYLVKANDATDADSVRSAGFIDLGDLKFTHGNQAYELPKDLDLGSYRAVTIWCRRFGVNFGTAPLQGP